MLYCGAVFGVLVVVMIVATVRVAAVREQEIAGMVDYDDWYPHTEVGDGK